MYIRSIFALLLTVVLLSATGERCVRAMARESRPSELVFSTNLGTAGYARAESVASDAVGNLYIVGEAKDAQFGGSPKINVFGMLGGEADIFVLKLNASGTVIEYVTLIGGTERESARSVALDGSGNIYVAASTSSPNLPVSGGVVRAYSGATDAYVAKLSPDGESLHYATYVGGSSDEYNPRLAVTGSGQVALVLLSASPDFPVTAGQEPISESAIVAVSLAPAGDLLIFSRILVRVIGNSFVADVAADRDGNFAVAGPGFVSRLTSDGADSATANSELRFERVTVDAGGNVYTAAVDDPDRPEFIYLQRRSPDLAQVTFEVLFAPRYNFRVQLADLEVDSAGNLYLADFEDGSTENYYGAVRRIDAKGRFTFERQITDALVGLSLSPSREVGVAGNSFLGTPTFKALVPDRGTFRSAFAAQLKFPAEVGTLPTIDRIERRPKPANPNKYRIVISGSGFQPGALVFVGDAKRPDPTYVVKSATRIVSKIAFPADSPPVALTIVNPDGGEVTGTYAR